MTQRTLIYARVSTEDQLEKYGLPSQLRACREYAASKGLTILEEITDDGISGTILERPGLDRVRQLVRAGDAEVVLAFDVDRLSRQLAHLLILKPEIEKKSRLEFVAAKFEDSPSGRLFFGIRGIVGEYEREQTRERLMRGKKERARNGLVVGGRTAYGYRYDAGKLVPDEVQAPVVAEIFGWYDAGGSIRSISRRLRERGTPSWGGGRWGHSSVRRVLVNETYAGVAHYGTLQRFGKELKKRESGERIGFTVPSLVPHELWERVQVRLSANPYTGRPSVKYLLRGLLYCSCGKKMCGNFRGGSLTYRCHGRDAEVGRTCRQSIPVKAVDRAIWATIEQAFCEEGFLRNLLATRQKELCGQVPMDLEKMRDQAKKLERKEKTCLAALLDPDLVAGRESIKAEYKKVQQERSRIVWDIASADRTARSASTFGCWLDDAVAAIRQYIPRLVATAERQEFLRGIVSRADWVGNGELRMACLFGPELSTTSSRSGQFEPLQVVLTARVA